MAQTVIGMFDNASEAQEAVQKLTSRGISRENIDVTNSGTGSSTSSSYSGSDTHEEESGVSRFFKNLFSDDDDDSNKYTTVASRSQSIVTVHAQSKDEAEDAADILDDCGAVDVDERAASYGYAGRSTTGSASNSITGTGAGLASDTTDYSNRTTGTTDETTKIPIIEENLEVGKREVLRGGVRLRSRIIERPVEESVRLREESVRVERTPVDRAASTSDLSNFKETEIEMTERAEVPVVSKEARVVEEVSLGKEVNERTETVSDTVRKTEVDVEDLTSRTDTTTDTTSTGYGSTNTNTNTNPSNSGSGYNL